MCVSNIKEILLLLFSQSLPSVVSRCCFSGLTGLSDLFSWFLRVEGSRCPPCRKRHANMAGEGAVLRARGSIRLVISVSVASYMTPVPSLPFLPLLVVKQLICSSLLNSAHLIFALHFALNGHRKHLMQKILPFFHSFPSLVCVFFCCCSD